PQSGMMISTVLGRQLRISAGRCRFEALALAGGIVLLGGSPPPPPVRIATSQPITPAIQQASMNPATPAHPVSPAPASPPVRLTIPRIGVDAPVSATGLNPDGTVEVPPMDHPEQVGWYREGPMPGQTGPAVLLGHLDTRKGPAVFNRLPTLRPGDRIDIARQDGTTVSYRVRELRQYPKAGFPTDLVYGNTDTPQLRLITCGGTLGGNGHYTDNIIVLADLA
ncbi:class F sortase, partial [Kitasatospora sp. NPDC002227]|uniref:class F sortase n=1 Tax=Kitasatospora sp. NPDC002227 TaxID=3154773 RepID=UPI003323CCD4